MSVDWSTMTDEDLAAALSQGRAEEQRRTRERTLLDQAHNLVLSAHNAGFTRAQVVAALGRVVNTYYTEV